MYTLHLAPHRELLVRLNGELAANQRASGLAQVLKGRWSNHENGWFFTLHSGYRFHLLHEAGYMVARPGSRPLLARMDPLSPELCHGHPVSIYVAMREARKHIPALTPQVMSV